MTYIQFDKKKRLCKEYFLHLEIIEAKSISVCAVDKCLWKNDVDFCITMCDWEGGGLSGFKKVNLSSIAKSQGIMW